jgi:hypothetical protein
VTRASLDRLAWQRAPRGVPMARNFLEGSLCMVGCVILRGLAVLLA